MTEPSDDFVAAWEHIIADITKTDVPLECIKKVVLKFHGGRQKTFNLATLKKQGLEDIVVVAGGVIPEKDHNFLFKKGVDFVFGPGTVIAEAATDILKKLESKI